MKKRNVYMITKQHINHTTYLDYVAGFIPSSFSCGFLTVKTKFIICQV